MYLWSLRWIRADSEAAHCNFSTAVEIVARALGIDGASPAPQRSILERVAASKRITVSALEAFGAVVADRDGQEVVRILVYNERGSSHSHFDLGIDGKLSKGMFKAGKGSSGLFFPGSLPKPGEIWLMVEGPKDACALHGLGFKACGLNTCEMNAKYARLFRGMRVILIPDRDEKSAEGFTKTANRLLGVATSVHLVTLPAERTPTHGADVRDILAKQDGESLVRQFIEDAELISGSSDSPRIEFQRITSQKLDSGDFAQEYLVEGVMVAQQPMIVAGPQKSLKTSVMLDLAVSLSTCGHFLGRFKVNRAANVAFMSGESGLAIIQETARRICKAAGTQLSSLNIIWSPDLPRFDRSDHHDALEEFLVADAVETLVIDPAYLAMPSENAGNLFAQGELLRTMTEVCGRNGVQLILAHHMKNRANPFEPPELSDISWSGFQEFARQWILIGRRERYEPGTGDHRLWLIAAGSAGHSGLWVLDVAERVCTRGAETVACGYSERDGR